jgi:D-beta-D-heptose 7-phosphate kinase/D-beta-D-heptose 1-phosphate adenosyltransferase
MKKIFVNGTFDILHPGHLRLLNYAKSLGDYLLVAIETDVRVKRLMGESRPINNQFERKEMLMNLKAVDDVVFFETEEELCTYISNFSIIIKGSDHKPNYNPSKYPIPTIWFDRIDEYSTTNKIQDIASR